MFWEAGIRDLFALANAGPQPEPVGETNQGPEDPARLLASGPLLELLGAWDAAPFVAHAAHLPRA